MESGLKQPRVVIVGAGPAGVRCAETLLAAGLNPVVIDENHIVRDIYVEPRDFESHPVHALEILAALDG